jgi:hypothetical protein
MLALALLAEFVAAQAPPTGFCFPNTPGLAICPCANPPMNVGSEGCNNFGDPTNGNQSTGGGYFGASGQASIANDTLLLSAYNVNPATFALLLESRNTNATGVPYGAGVRCLASPILRVYGHNDIRLTSHTGGADWGPSAGDPMIHTAIGASVGELTFFQVWYRDPNALTHCPNSNTTFNVTAGLVVTWYP